MICSILIIKAEGFFLSSQTVNQGWTLYHLHIKFLPPLAKLPRVSLSCSWKGEFISTLQHVPWQSCTVTESSNSSIGTGTAGELLALGVNNVSPRVLLSEQSVSGQLSPSIVSSASPSSELLITIVHGS